MTVSLKTGNLNYLTVNDNRHLKFNILGVQRQIVSFELNGYELNSVLVARRKQLRRGSVRGIELLF